MSIGKEDKNKSIIMSNIMIKTLSNNMNHTKL